MECYEACPLNSHSLPFVWTPKVCPNVSFTLYLLRHPQVTSNMEGICYGDSDVALEPEWHESIQPKLSYLQQLTGQDRITEVWHSDLNRTRQPAEWLGSQLGAQVMGDSRLRERHFGSWQNLAWANIPHAEIMNAHDMLEKPNTFRPGKGETTTEVIERVTRWLNDRLAIDKSSISPIVIVAHSGSITSLCGSLLGLAPSDWTPYYLKPSEWLIVSNCDQSGKT